MRRLLVSLSALVLTQCGPTSGNGRGPHGGGGDLAANDSGGGGDDSGVNTDDFGGIETDGGTGVVADPTTCGDAAANHTYIGCDYWPTVVANAVWSIFDFSVVVANPGTMPATVTVTGPQNTNQTVTVQPNQLAKIYLPWVSDLKGADANNMGGATPPTASVLSKKAAFHLVSTVPVLVYQFNALEYAPKGGPAGKSWSSCPSNGMNGTPPCFSYSNDASLLMPSTAMTGNYRVVTEHGLDGFGGTPGFPPGCMGSGCVIPPTPAQPGMPGYFAITAVQDGTTVKIKLPQTGSVLAGSGVSAVAAGATASFTLDSGDVLELMGAGATASDLSGAQVQASNPVQVIAGSPCIANPPGGMDAMGNPLSCDHLEATVLPAETLGKHYVVPVSTGPRGTPVGQTVRFVGNVDGTHLTFTPQVAGAPATLDAGQVVEIAKATQDFEVSGDHEFLVATIMLSGGLLDPNAAGGMQEGDPSLSTATAVEQYRLKYVFLAPDDYDLNYADVIAPMGTHVMLDGNAVTQTATQLAGGSTFGIIRIKLASSNGGTHVLTADQPIGLQVVGYGLYTSYQYPAGLDLLTIAPPPMPIN
jgi:hypothetical protein